MHLTISQREQRGWRHAFFAACGLLALTFSAKVANGDQYCSVGTSHLIPQSCPVTKQTPAYPCCSDSGCYTDPNVGDVCCQYSCITYTLGGTCGGQVITNSGYVSTNFKSTCSASGSCQAATGTPVGLTLPFQKPIASGDGSMVLDGGTVIASAK